MHSLKNNAIPWKVSSTPVARHGTNLPRCSLFPIERIAPSLMIPYTMYSNRGHQIHILTTPKTDLPRDQSSTTRGT